MIFGLLALMLAAAYSGAAIYISAVEHPARLRLDDNALLTQWKQAYKSGFWVQAPLCVAAGFCAFVAFFVDWDWKWFFGAALILANVLATLYLIAPLCKTLIDAEAGTAAPDIRIHITRWAWAHGVQAAVCAVVTLMFLSAAL
jgi:Domain of unknown function (DUF1772)